MRAFVQADIRQPEDDSDQATLWCEQMNVAAQAANQVQRQHLKLAWMDGGMTPAYWSEKIGFWNPWVIMKSDMPVEALTIEFCAYSIQGKKVL